jgi:hypothetical protein
MRVLFSSTRGVGHLQPLLPYAHAPATGTCLLSAEPVFSAFPASLDDASPGTGQPPLRVRMIEDPSRAALATWVPPIDDRPLVYVTFGAPAALVYISGVAEILGGLGLIVAIFPANIDMAVHHLPLGGREIPTWALWARLPLQAVLVVWVYWCSQRAKPGDAAGAQTTHPISTRSPWCPRSWPSPRRTRSRPRFARRSSRLARRCRARVAGRRGPKRSPAASRP